MKEPNFSEPIYRKVSFLSKGTIAYFNLYKFLSLITVYKLVSIGQTWNHVQQHTNFSMVEVS